MGCDVKCYKRFETVFSHHQLVLRMNGTTHGPTNGIRAKDMGSSRGSVIVREKLLGGSKFDSLQPL